MKRRELVSSAAAGAALTPFAGSAVAQSDPSVAWRMVSSFPKSLDVLFGAMKLIADRVAALTDGKFQIHLFGAGELVPGLKVLDAVQNGSIECGHGPSYFYVGKDPTFTFDTALPFGLNTRQQNAWMQQGGLELTREFMRAYNVIHFPAANSGAQMGGWFRKEINRIEDLSGLRFRIPGLAGRILAKIGVVPQQIAPGDVFTALETGTIDAAEFVGPHDDEKLGFYEVAPYYYYPGWWEGSAQASLFVNLDKWNALPARYQAAIEVACAEANAWTVATYDTLNMQAMQRLVLRGAKLRPFPKDVLDACYAAAYSLYDELAAENPKFRKIYEDWTSFRKNSGSWLRIVENSYDSYVYERSKRS
jgi:TRAP-type mannitol/chloroaromatic compound transport system substrate-binding protein